MALVKSTVVANAATATGTFPASGGFTPSGWSSGQFDTSIALVVTISATSGSPSLIFKLQGSVDGGNTYADIFLLPSDSNTQAISFTKSSTSTWIYFVDQSPAVRKFSHYQVVVSTATTVTYTVTLCEVS